jgi:chaperone modulatory protein CbpM
MHTREFILHARIEAEELEKWVAAGWLVPRRKGAGEDYSELDVARAHFIRDLHVLGVNEEGIPIVLDLVDQIHGLRRMLRELLAQQQERSP